MRNLSIANINEARFSSDKLPLSASTFDTSTGDVIYTLGPTASQPIVELRRQSNVTGKFQDDSLITSWDAPCPLPDLDCDEVLSLHHFSESSSICIVLAGGDLVLVREKPLPDQERIEIVGSIDVGLSSARWSWNASLLALVTRSGSLVLMSQQLEPVVETAFHENDLSMSKHVSVGWGKKETQFQGKRAKAMKDPTMPDFVDEGKPSPNEDGETVISWRGDGAFVAVYTVQTVFLIV
jgi:elongator complex protein 1